MVGNISSIDLYTVFIAIAPLVGLAAYSFYRASREVGKAVAILDRFDRQLEKYQMH